VLKDILTNTESNSLKIKLRSKQWKNTHQIYKNYF
jgi:hypothetical protein